MTLTSRKSAGVFVDDVLELAPVGVRKIAALSDAVEQARMLRPQQSQKAVLERTHAQNVERVEIPVDAGVDHADLLFHLQRRELGLLEKLGQSCAAIEQALRRSIEVRAELGDRKSTRLNSSQLGISYAVFCLKKKNNKKQRKSE